MWTVNGKVGTGVDRRRMFSTLSRIFDSLILYDNQTPIEQTGYPPGEPRARGRAKTATAVVKSAPGRCPCTTSLVYKPT